MVRYRHLRLEFLWILLPVTLAQDCPFTMWVFDSLERCDSIDPPNAIGTLYADGQCRGIENVEGSSSSALDLFPGYYTAVCTGAGKLRLENAGCISETCDVGEFGVCEVDSTAPGHLFSKHVPPEYQVQQATGADSAGFYTCYRLKGSESDSLSVTFVIFGDCGVPSCQKHASPLPNPIIMQNPAPSWPSWPVAPTAIPPTAPFTWRPLSPHPTPAPKPTNSPTQRPTRSPVTVPTTFDPTTSAPSISPTVLPTLEPTMSPSFTRAPVPEVILTETESVRAGLKLSEMGGLMEIETLAVWTEVTKRHITASVPEVLNTEIEVVEQEAFAISSRKHRVLSGTALKLQFDVAVEYIAGSVVNVEDLFAKSFDEEKERIQYVRELARRDTEAFGLLNQISVLGEDDSKSPESQTPDGSTPKPAILIGSISSVALSLIAGFCVVMYLFRRKFNESVKAERLPQDTPEESSTSQRKQPAQKYYTNEILVDTEADDVSTLGGSVLNTANATTVGDEPTASVNLDYDFEKKQYIIDSNDTTAAFSAVSKSLVAGDSVFDDDDVSFEQQYADSSNHVKRSFRPFEVQAPPGLLGMVVDTPGNSGIPVVRAIKPDSVLSGQILIGDRLIAVDDQDVTKMSAMAVSNLISLKQDNERLLVFVRIV